MKLTKFLITISIIGIIVQITGCFGPGTASFGSRYKVFDSTALKRVSRVYLFPVFSRIDTSHPSMIDDSATVMLWREIDSRDLFKLVPIDSLYPASKEVGSWDSTSALKIAQMVSADAFIYPHMEYSKAAFGEKVADLSLPLVDPQTDKVIVYAHHNTYLGNSYFLPPGFETVRGDVIKGAVDALAKAIKELDKK